MAQDESPPSEDTKFTNLEIGEAVKYLRGGFKVARRGWNGRGMYLSYFPGCPTPNVLAHSPEAVDAVTALGLPPGSKLNPHVLLKSPDGSFTPWNASQADLSWPRTGSWSPSPHEGADQHSSRGANDQCLREEEVLPPKGERPSTPPDTGHHRRSRPRTRPPI